MKKSILIFLITLSALVARSQQHFLNLNQEYNRNVEMAIYSPDHHFHTSIRPYYIPEIQQITNYDSIRNLYWIKREFNKNWKQKTWDKAFNDDVVALRKADYAIVANPLMDFSLSPSGGGQGEDASGGGAEGGGGWTNTRGFEIKARIGSNVTFYTNFRENQAKFPGYLDTYIRRNNIIPGQGMIHTRLENGGFDYSNASGYLSVKAGKYFNFQLGHGKNFYGDGYRSLLLSDNSFNSFLLLLS